MSKTSSEAMLDAVAEDFHMYLRKGVRVDQVVGEAHADLDVDDLGSLLRIHFVLTDAEDDENSVGVLDFMRELEDRIRRMKTTTASESFEHRGEVRGRIDWQGTIKTRSRAGQPEEPLFVCTRPEEHYTIDENLVLKRLLAVVHEIVTEDLKYALENPDGYGWLEEWADPDGGDQRTPESAAKMLDRIYERNVYLQRIDLEEAAITDRTIESVKRSRSRFYQEAAILLDRYRKLTNQELDSEEAREVLDHTLVAPEKEETLFELYWIFKLLEAYDDVQYHVLTDSKNSSTIASWDRDGYRYVLSHDATGEDLTFDESLGDETIEDDGYLYRQREVIDRWRYLSKEILDRDRDDSLWGGRPDIVLERYREGGTGDSPDQVFLGEVKYTQNVEYAATGLRELLEYMAFVSHSGSGDYVESKDNLLKSVDVQGLLFVDDLDRELDSPEGEDIEVVQYSQSPEQVL